MALVHFQERTDLRLQQLRYRLADRSPEETVASVFLLGVREVDHSVDVRVSVRCVGTVNYVHEEVPEGASHGGRIFPLEAVSRL